MTTRNDDFSQSLTFGSDPVAYLEAIARAVPSKELLSRLAGPVASAMKDVQTTAFAPLYLRAVAQQLAAETGTAAPATTVAAAGSSVGPSVISHGKVEVEAEMKSVHQIYEIAEAIGHAVAHCTPRSTISQSGILSAMANLLFHNNSTVSVNILSSVHVEFLQACVYAEQYRYAERIMGNLWPRPNSSVSVRQVLRYYYTRGTIHMGCQNWKLAVRCFWTCLSVPAEVVSAVAIAAWKKMVLVQFLIQSDAVKLTSAMLMATPAAAPSCLGRFLTLASSVKNNPAVGGIAGNDNNDNNNNNTAGGREQRQRQHQPEQVMNMVEGTSSEGSAMSSSSVIGHDPRQQTQNANANNGLGVHVYTELIHAFVKIDKHLFHRILQKHGAQFAADGNVGIVAQCEAELVRRQVYELSRIYAVISLEQLSAMLELPVDQVQTLLLQLSIDKKWKIQMEDDGMVVFPKLGAEHSSVEDAKDVEELIQLTKVVQKLDVNIASSSKYHTFVRRENSAKSSEGKGGPRGVEDVSSFLA